VRCSALTVRSPEPVLVCSLSTACRPGRSTTWLGFPVTMTARPSRVRPRTTELPLVVGVEQPAVAVDWRTCAVTVCGPGRVRLPSDADAEDWLVPPEPLVCAERRFAESRPGTLAERSVLCPLPPVRGKGPVSAALVVTPSTVAERTLACPL